MNIKDAKLRSVYRQIDDERAADPGRRIEEKDLVSLFAAVADRAGKSYAKAQIALRAAPTWTSRSPSPSRG